LDALIGVLPATLALGYSSVERIVCKNRIDRTERAEPLWRNGICSKKLKLPCTVEGAEFVTKGFIMEKPIRTKESRHIFPPPRLLPHGEMAPVIEPPLHDMDPFPGAGAVDEWEMFHSGRGDFRLESELTRRAQVAAERDARVRKLLDGKRHIAIGASLREMRDKPNGRQAILRFVFYNYDQNLAVDVTLDTAAKNVLEVRTATYQPPPLQSEIDEAIRLARRDARLVDHLTDDLEAMAILVSEVEPRSANFSPRLLDVRFGCPDERLARFMAIVDLSTETVLKAGSCNPCNTNCQGRDV